MRSPAFVVCLFLTGFASAYAAERYALVVGIDEYQALGKLKTCRADAKALAKVLVENCGFPQDHIILLTDDQKELKNLPTGGILKAAVNQLATLPGPDDTVLIFFSGHGVMVDGEGYLVAVDGDAQGGLALSDLKAKMQQCKARTKVLILDACHAGSGAKGVPGLAADLARADTGLIMLLSCAADQESYPDDETGHSVFSQYLIEGIAGAADANTDETITHDELFRYVKAQVTRWCLKSRKTQAPVLFGEPQAPVPVAKLVKGKPVEIVRPPVKKEIRVRDDNMPTRFAQAVVVQGFRGLDMRATHITPDGKRMLLTLWDGPARIHESTWDSTANRWGKPSMLEVKGAHGWAGGGSWAPDGKTLFFASHGRLYASRDGRSADELVILGSGEAPYFTGKTLYFHRDEGSNGQDIWCADYDDAQKQFCRVRPLREVNTAEWSESDAYVTADGKTLLFASNRPGGFGGKDIWAATWSGERWGEFQNMGPSINTDGEEFKPFYCAGTRVLYFTRVPKGRPPEAGLLMQSGPNRSP